MRLEQLKAEEAKLKKELKAVRKRIKKSSPEDGWYIAENQNCFTEKLIMYAVDGLVKFGVDEDGDWIEIKEDHKLAPVLRLATKEEYTKRLTEFVNSKYKDGDIVSQINNYNLGLMGRKNPFKLDAKALSEPYLHDNKIWLENLIIWQSDKGWAEIIEKKPKYTVEPKKFGFYRNEVFSDFTILKDGGMILGDECEQIAKQIENFLNT